MTCPTPDAEGKMLDAGAPATRDEESDVADRQGDGRKGERWSYTAGERPYCVRVFERRPGGNIYVAAWDPTLRGGRGGERKRSLKHKDRDAAIAYADEQAAKLRRHGEAAVTARPTTERVFKLYRRERTPDKAPDVQKMDERHVEMWKRYLGPGFDLSRLSRREWDAFRRDRASGRVDARGHTVPKTAPCPNCGSNPDPDCERCDGTGQISPRRPVGPRTVAIGLKFLQAVCRWATEYRSDEGRFLLDEDPTRGLDVPKEKNPSRPVATHDRVDAIREVYRQPRMEIIRDGKKQKIETYLPEIFEIVVGTGRRISAVCALRAEDLHLESRPNAPDGAIVWPEDTDKIGKRWRCPISRPVREALVSAQRKRGRVGPGPLFPGPRKPEQPVGYRLVSKWLRGAEGLAGVEPHDGSLWHAYRRLWASARKHLPDVDVAQAGGWSSVDALKLAYQRPDDATMLRVVQDDTELREVK